jgi:hypothetical protein
MIWQNIILGNTLSDSTYNKEEVYVKGVINQSLSEYQLKILSVDIYVNGKYNSSISQFILLDTLISDTLSITSNPWLISGLDNPDFKLMDANFDGYNDLFVLTGYSANGMVEEYGIYLFNTINKHFEYDRNLSNEIGFNTMIDKETEEITAGGADGFMNFQWRTFKYINGKLLMIHVETQERLDSLDSKTNIPLYRWYEQVRENNDLVTTREIIGTIEEIERETR